MAISLPAENIQFRVPTELLREFKAEPRIVIRHPWVIGIPAPELFLKEDILHKIQDSGFEADRGTSKLKSLCSMEYRYRLQKKISHIYHI